MRRPRGTTLSHSRGRSSARLGLSLRSSKRSGRRRSPTRRTRISSRSSLQPAALKTSGAHLKKGRSSSEITAGDGSPEPLEGGALFPPGQVSGEEASCDRRPHCKQVRRGGREKTLSRGSCPRG